MLRGLRPREKYTIRTATAFLNRSIKMLNFLLCWPIYNVALSSWILSIWCVSKLFVAMPNHRVMSLTDGVAPDSIHVQVEVVLRLGLIYFGNFLPKAPIRYATWFDLQCVSTSVSGHFDSTCCKQASTFWNMFPFFSIIILAKVRLP